MKRNLIVKQRDSKDCGVCSLLSIIKFYGGFVPLEKLRIDTYTNNDGTTFYHLIKALNKYGFEATGMKISEDVLNNGELRLPLIAHLQFKNNMTHFVVVYKVTKDIVLVMDPAIGFMKMKKEEFFRLWTNRILLINPIHKIVTLPKDKSLINLFINTLPLEKEIIFKILITSLCLMFFSILSSFYFKIAIDEWNQSGDLLKVILIIFLIMIIVKIILKYIRKNLENYLNKNIDIRIISEFIKHIFLLPLNLIKSRSTGEIITRISDLNNIKSLFSDIFIAIFLDLLLALTAMFVLFMINDSLFFILCLIIIVYLAVGIFFSPITYRAVLKTIDRETEFNSHLVENVEGVLTIKNTNQTDYILNNIYERFAKYLRETFKMNNLLNIQSTIKDFINEIGLFAITSYGIYLITKNQMKLIDLVTFNTLLVYLIDPVKNIVDLLPSINHLKVTFSKISEFLSMEREDLGKNDEVLAYGDICISDLCYSYNDYDYIINNVNLSIKASSKTFMAGPSGSGKSTICKLIYRLLDYQKGSITIKGINIKDYKLRTIRDNISYLAQKEVLFSDSIKNNIVFGRIISEERLHRIIDICRIEEILRNKPLRLETILIDGGYNFSGGERQRIALARTLVKNASIIILDEALSEVEEGLERAIIKDLLKEFKDKTIVYVSHRDNRKYFDNIIELEGINV